MGFELALQPNNLLAMFIGTLLGYVVGAMPGINPTIGLALLIPFTYRLDAVTSIILLVVLYKAFEYGGGITAILVNTPGNAANAATALDGYPLALQGKATTALGISIISSSFGAFGSSILMMLFALPLAAFALRFAAPEHFFLAMFGLSVVSGLSSDNMTKGLLAVMFGLLVTTIGIDPVDGTLRYIFTFHFMEGIPFVPAMVGLFAFAEVLTLLSQSGKDESKQIIKTEGGLPTRSELMYCMPTIVRSTIIGFVIGIIPAVGANVASWISYNAGKSFSKNPEMFGKGALDGIAASETANNASVPGALVPTFTLGIPGSPAAAVLIGALIMQGLQPGPLLFTRNPEIPFSTFAAMIISVPVMLAVGLLGAPLFGKVVLIPRAVLSTMIVSTCVLGAYALVNHIFGVWIAFGFGILGFLLRKLKFPIAPIVLALVLGTMAERNFRVALLMGEGSPLIFITRPLSIAIAVLALISFSYPFIQAELNKRRSKNQTQ